MNLQSAGCSILKRHKTPAQCYQVNLVGWLCTGSLAVTWYTLCYLTLACPTFNSTIPWRPRPFYTIEFYCWRKSIHPLRMQTFCMVQTTTVGHFVCRRFMRDCSSFMSFAVLRWLCFKKYPTNQSSTAFLLLSLSLSVSISLCRFLSLLVVAMI